MFVDIEVSPISSDCACLFILFFQRMMAQQTGSSALIAGPRAQQKGSASDGVIWLTDKQYTYYYDTVAGTDYAFAFVLAEEDKLQYDLQDFAYSGTQGYNYYHEISKYTGSKATALNRRTGFTGYSRLTVALAQSSVKLAPRAFCDPTHFALAGDPDFAYMDAFLNSNQTNLQCDAGGRVMPAIR